MEWRGTYGEVLYGFHVAARFHDWTLAPDEMNPDASIVTARHAEADEFWSGYEPTALRVRVGERWWTYTGPITVLSDTLYCVSGTPEVTAL